MSYTLPVGEKKNPKTGKRKKEEVKKITYSETKTLGFSTRVQESFLQERAPLEAAGNHVDEMHANLKKVHDEVVQLGAEQEDLKRELKDKTAKLNDALKRLYNLASGGVDALMTAVEKSSPAAKILRRLRSDLRTQYEAEPPTVRPVPEKIE